MEAKHQTFSYGFLISLIASVRKIIKTFQIEISEPLADVFQTLYQNYLKNLEHKIPQPSENKTLI